MNNIHLVIAHPNPESTSLNHAIKQQWVNDFSEDHDVSVTDLYEWHRCAHPAVQPYEPNLPAEANVLIGAEQLRIEKSELLILQFPMYWFSVPGLMKNYIDQVFRPGFAYPGKFSQSPLHNGRQVLFSITTQSDEAAFSAQGPNGSVLDNLFHLATAFRFMGFRIRQPLVLFDAYHVIPTMLSKHIKEGGNIIRSDLSSDTIWLEAELKESGA